MTDALLIPIIIIAFIALSIWLIKDIRSLRHKPDIAQILKDAQNKVLADCQVENSKNGIIEIDDQGFTVFVKQRKKEYNASVKWDDIKEIRVFKRDLFATDLICWWFCTDAENEQGVEISEDMWGYKKLIEEVESRFDIDKEWFGVAFPAFATNMRTVWPKPEKSKENPV